MIGEYNIPIGLFFDLILILEYKKENNQEKLSISEIISEKEEEIENPNSNNWKTNFYKWRKKKKANLRKY